MNLKELKIKERRGKLNLTQMQLAAACGVSLMSVRLWENGIGQPKEANYKKLIEVLKVLPFDE